MQLKNKSLFHEKSFINGKWVSTKKTISVYNPSTEKLIGSINNCDEKDANNAINCALRAFEKWSKLTGKERAKILHKWYELIIENQDDLAAILTSEQGKPIAEAKGEILYGASFVQWFSEEAKRINGEVILAPKNNQKIITTVEPIGVVAAITPWNFPSAMITRKAAAAIAAGCAIISKTFRINSFFSFSPCIFS